MISGTIKVMENQNETCVGACILFMTKIKRPTGGAPASKLTLAGLVGPIAPNGRPPTTLPEPI